jgi:surface antigen
MRTTTMTTMRPERRRPAALAALALGLALAGCRTAGTFDGPDLYARLSDRDVALASQTLQETLERHQENEPANWANPESGNAGVIWPVDTYLTDTGYFCREYRETVVIADGERFSYDNTACRNDEGHWVWVD